MHRLPRLNSGAELRGYNLWGFRPQIEKTKNCLPFAKRSGVLSRHIGISLCSRSIGTKGAVLPHLLQPRRIAGLQFVGI